MRLPIFAATGSLGWLVVAIAATIIWALPLVLNDPFFILVLQSLAYLYIAAIGVDILVGWTGQISLGHAGLYAVGAYTSALLATKASFPFWISAPLGVAAAGIAGVVLALPCSGQRPVPGYGHACFRLHGGGHGESLGFHGRADGYHGDPRPHPALRRRDEPHAILG
jgi:hypothetical protein